MSKQFDRIKTLILAGQTPNQIAEKTGSDLSYISTVRKRAGLPALQRGRKVGSAKPARFRAIHKLRQSGLTMQQIADRFDLTRARIDQILKPDRHRARISLNRLVTHGRITRSNICDNCGASGLIEAHHEDYSRPFDVQWLCRPCHNKIARPYIRTNSQVHCLRCGHSWHPVSQHSKVCPACHSRYWNAKQKPKRGRPFQKVKNNTRQAN